MTTTQQIQNAHMIIALLVIVIISLISSLCSSFSSIIGGGGTDWFNSGCNTIKLKTDASYSDSQSICSDRNKDTCINDEHNCHWRDSLLMSIIESINPTTESTP